MIDYLPKAKVPKPSGTRYQGKNIYWKTPVDMKLTTIGNGLWSNECRVVRHNNIEINGFMDSDCDGDDRIEYFRFYEMRVGFNRGWDIGRHGLIYTDPGWIKNLKQELVKLGFSKYSLSGADYSEQGMQGNNYVSLDIDDKFARKFFQVFYNGK